MRNLHFVALLALLSAGILGAATPADDFYLVRLQAGKAEAAAGRHYEAIADFRIASFGFLDQPALLVEGLARLALAQAAAGRNEDTDETLRRFVEIEKRFNGWPQASVEPATRAAVVALVEKRLGPEAAKVLAAPVATPVPTPAPTPVPTAAPEVVPASVTTSATILAESKALVAQGRYVENQRRLVAAVAAEPANRELRKALLEGAVLTKDWTTAVAQLEPLRPFLEGEEPWMFYAAVALLETGKADEARELTRMALPRLSRSPFVDYYSKRILKTNAKN